MKNQGITFSYKNPDHAARNEFETLVEVIARNLGPIQELPARTILVDFAPESNPDIFYDTNLVNDGCVGCRLTAKELARKIWGVDLDPRIAEANFNELRAQKYDSLHKFFKDLPDELYNSTEPVGEIRSDADTSADNILNEFEEKILDKDQKIEDNN